MRRSEERGSYRMLRQLNVFTVKAIAPLLVGRLINERGVGHMSKAKTYNEGANDERTAIVAKLRRDKRDHGPKGTRSDSWIERYLEKLIGWMMERSQRTGYAPGGIGKKLVRPTTKTRPSVKAK